MIVPDESCSDRLHQRRRQGQLMRTSIAASAGTPEILLITDSTVDDGHLKYVRRLFGECTGDDDIAYSPDRRFCRWPLRVDYPAGVVKTLSFHVHLCAGFLTQRRKVIDQIRALGCNLELCVHVQEFREPFDFTMSTMKQMADLCLQFSLIPTQAANLAPSDGWERIRRSG